MGTHGGARKKAGKPKGKKAQHTIEAVAARARLIQHIHEDMDELYTAWKAAAVGHYQEKVLPLTGQTVVYLTKPNPMAIKDLVDRAMGKPVQPIDGNGKDPLDLSQRAKDLAKPFLAALDPDDEDET